ncbi:MAG: hypothetical protein L0J54_06105, partial [Halomonas sp.]|nr:hypothetical protein [Halomonas sp.]
MFGFFKRKKKHDTRDATPEDDNVQNADATPDESHAKQQDDSVEAPTPPAAAEPVVKDEPAPPPVTEAEAKPDPVVEPASELSP